MGRLAVSIPLFFVLLVNVGPSWGQSRPDPRIVFAVNLDGAPMSARSAPPAPASDNPINGRWTGILVPLFRNSSAVDFTLTQDQDAVDGMMRGAFQYMVKGTFDSSTMHLHASFTGVGRTGTLDGTLTDAGTLLRGVFQARGFLFNEAGSWEAHKIAQQASGLVYRSLALAERVTSVRFALLRYPMPRGFRSRRSPRV